MATTPDPKAVREIARKFLLDPHMLASELKALIRDAMGPDASDETFGAWYDAVRADARAGEVETIASWPAEQPQDAQPERSAAEIVWLTQDDEGNFGVWHDPDNARRQIIQDRAAEVPGHYEWVSDVDRTHEVLLRDDEVTGLTLWMALVADAAQGAQEP